MYSPSDPAEDTETGEGSRWTSVEYMFTPQTAGKFLLESFQISVGHKQNNTSPIIVEVSSPSQGQRQTGPSFSWERIPSVMAAGSAIELTLVLSNWDASKPAPRNLFRGRVPENSILEELPFIGPGSDRLIRYPVRIIPLEKGNFILNPLVVQHEGETLEIPRMAVPVVEAGSAANSGLPLGQAFSPVLSMEEGDFDNSAPVFPQNGKAVFGPFQKEYEGIVAEAALLWGNGQYAQALAFVRMNERDRFYGNSLVPLRRDMEKELGLIFSVDEKRRGMNRPLLLIILAVVCAVIAFLVTSRKLKGYSHVIGIVFGGVGLLFFLIVLAGHLRDTSAGFIAVPAIYDADASGKKPEPGGTAILLRTYVYRIPDSEGAVIFSFDEGQAVRIRSSPGLWIHVESPDGRSGWVQGEYVIPY
jgi:hypothetical protein